MATFYLDPVLGDDTKIGTSWANAWKTLATGATAARIAPGDTIRVVKSPDPMETGRTATWNSSLDSVLQLNATSVTATTPINVTVANHGLTTGDYVYMTNSTPLAHGLWKVTVSSSSVFSLNGSSGTTAVTFGTLAKVNSRVVELDQPVTQVIDNCETAWTAVKGTNVASNNYHREGGYMIVQTAPSTGNTANSLYAYKTLPAPLDLSGYQQISFWYGTGLTTSITATSWKICLCSDTAGTVIVHEIPLPAHYINASPSIMCQCVVNLGVPMGSAIQSVALYTGATNTASSVSIQLDHIIASKAASDPEGITLGSLISPNGIDWYGIGSINGTTIVLESNNSKYIPLTNRGYGGPAGSFPLYRRDTTPLPYAGAQNTAVMNLKDSGTAASKIRLEGGWDRATTVRNGHTVFDGRCYWGYGINLENFSHWDISGISLTRFGSPLMGTTNANFNNTMSLGFIASCAGQVSLNGVGCRLTVGSVTQTSSGVALSGTNNEATIGRISGVGDGPTSGSGLTVTGIGNRVKFTEIHNAYNGIYALSGRNISVEGNLVKNCIQEGIRVGATLFDTAIRGVTIQNGGGTDVTLLTNAEAALRNCTFGTVTTTDYNDSRLYSENHGGEVGFHRVFTDGMLIQTAQPAFVTRSGGWVWQATPTTSATRLVHNPVEMSLGRIAVTAWVPVTATIQVRKSTTDLVNLGFRLMCRGGQIAGVPDDVVAEATGAADTWTPCSISFTPGQTGVVELTALLHGTFAAGRTLYFTDLVIS